MLMSRPKRKKVKRILIVISRLAADKLDEEIDDSVYSVLVFLLMSSMAVFALEESNWDVARTNVWDEVENLHTAFGIDSEGVSQSEPSISELESICTRYEDAVSQLPPPE